MIVGAWQVQNLMGEVSGTQGRIAVESLGVLETQEEQILQIKSKGCLLAEASFLLWGGQPLFYPGLQLIE